MSVVSKAVIQKINSYGDNIKEFILKIENYEEYDPGQFLQLTLENVDASSVWPESRTFSIASFEEGIIRLVIKRVGNYTTRIFEELKKGGVCTIKYAYGDFLLPMFDEEEKIHCIAGGTGIAPFLSFIEFLVKEKKEERLFLYYSVQKEEDFIALESIKDKLPERNIKLYTTRNESSYINRRIELEDIKSKSSNLIDEHVYICGSSEFNKKYFELFKNEGIENLYLEDWG